MDVGSYKNVTEIQEGIRTGEIELYDMSQDIEINSNVIFEYEKMIEENEAQIERLQESIHLEVHASKKLRNIGHYLLDIIGE